MISGRKITIELRFQPLPRIPPSPLNPAHSLVRALAGMYKVPRFNPSAKLNKQMKITQKSKHACD